MARPEPAKSFIAKALHNGSIRMDKMLIIVNCAALPSELIESDLFGHEVGAFTGATTGARAGLNSPMVAQFSSMKLAS